MSGDALIVTAAIAALAPATQSQIATGAQFDVVSIKPHKNDPGAGGGMQCLPDGTFMMTNQPIASIIPRAQRWPTRPSSQTFCARLRSTAVGWPSRRAAR